MNHSLVLRFLSPDRAGIVAKVTQLLSARGCDIRAAEVYGDPDTGRFFSRIELTSPIDRQSLAAKFGLVGDELELDWQLDDRDRKQRVLIAVSKFGHCLIDLIHKQEIGQLPIEIVSVVSNTTRCVRSWSGTAWPITIYR